MGSVVGRGAGGAAAAWTGSGDGRRLVGKVALISGAARGMGESHARAMVAHGAQVVLGDIADDAGRAVAEELGPSARYLHLDVTNRDDWAAAVAATLEAFGRLNVLVNNAGIMDFGPVDEYAPAQWDRVIAVNLTGVFNGISAASPALRAHAPSSIINISSVAGLRGYANTPGYTASKFGVRGLTKAAAVDLGAFGVRVNSVHPGAVSTAMTQDLDLQVARVPLRRVAAVEEISHLVVFLASDESSFCTGSEFVIDGGSTAGDARAEPAPVGDARFVDGSRG
jgi:3alpha(or 20beta)-hydroxysteroid dehydrogenase